jgi:hypothetical protein
MGHTEFLIGQNGSTPSNLPAAIANLEDASMIFISRWQQRDYGRAGEVSQSAMGLFDFIANELLRERVERMGLGTYLRSPFEAEMNILCANGVTGVSVGDQQSIVSAGPGNGHVPINAGTAVTLSLDRLLNKIKHRNPKLMNFRISSSQHIFLICPEHTSGGPEGIYEFNVEEFCRQCRAAANEL